MAENRKALGQEASARPAGIAETVVAVAVIGIGAALIEVEWIPGILIGIGAMLVPKLIPGFTDAMKPVVRTAIRGGYNAAVRTREAVTEAKEQVEDIIAEARAEQVMDAATAKQPPASRSLSAH
jgi:hypothetical protein